MRGNTGRPRLLLADDHAILVEGLRRLLQPEFDFVGAVGDGWALLEAAERLKPDVIVADVSMPLLNGIEAVRRLKKVCPRAKVIILSMHGDVEVAVGALKAGASGYVLKHSAAEALSNAIWEVLEGRIYVSPRIARDVIGIFIESSQRKDGLAVQLTQREREVLQLVAEGRTIKGISVILKVALRTVVFHKSNIMDKVGLRTTADLTQYAIKSGLIMIDKPGTDSVVDSTESTLPKAIGAANFFPTSFGGAQRVKECTESGETMAASASLCNDWSPLEPLATPQRRVYSERNQTAEDAQERPFEVKR